MRKPNFCVYWVTTFFLGLSLIQPTHGGTSSGDVLILNTGNTLASVTLAAQSTGLNQPPLVGLELSSSPTPFSSSPPTLISNPFEPKPILPQSGMLVLIFLAFAAGVFSFLSPCTLPILPAYFAITAQTDRTRISMMSIAFFMGLATLFMAMGASASVMGQVIRDHLFSLTTIGGIVVILFGIMTLFGKGFSGANFQGKPASTFIGFFLFGATFALGWTPCVGPILSGILILAATDKTILQGMNLLFFYAVGLGLPLIIISTFFGQLSKESLFWRVLRGKGWEFRFGNHVLVLHTTNLFSGLLLITLGVALSMGYLTYLNSLIPLEIQIWFSDFEEKVLHWFM
ncbi:MAG: cytochrome c biogenesis protein CcdA [Nitrospinae bacterium]|nr:cytochrome c biogenesis protein CcdA [Nitrospinota bacterium]